MDQGTIKESVTKAICRALAVTRWSKETLAAEIGVRSSTIRRWANGAVDDYTLAPVARLFNLAGLSLDEALGLRASVPSKGVDDFREWRERAEMYEGLLKILTRQTLATIAPPLVSAGEGLNAGQLANLPSASAVRDKRQQEQSSIDTASRCTNDGQDQKRTGTG